MNKKLIASLLSYFVLSGLLVWSTVRLAKSESELFINISILSTAAAFGWVVGIGISPYNENERKQFSKLASAVSIFISGYLLSKIDPLLTSILDPNNALTDVIAIRILGAIGLFILTLTVTFVGRQYGR